MCASGQDRGTVARHIPGGHGVPMIDAPLKEKEPSRETGGGGWGGLEASAEGKGSDDGKNEVCSLGTI